MKRLNENKSNENVPMRTLSHDEEEGLHVSVGSKDDSMQPKNQSSNHNPLHNSACVIDSAMEAKEQPVSNSCLDDPVYVTETSNARKKRKKRKRKKQTLQKCKVTSITDKPDLNKVRTFEEKWNQPSTSADSLLPVSDICLDESSLNYIKDASKKRRKRTKRRKKILSSSDISEAISTLDTADLNKVKTFEEKWNQPSTSADSSLPVSDICFDESSLKYIKDASKKRRKRTKRRKKNLSSYISEATSTLDTADLNKVRTFEEKWNQPSTSADSSLPVSDICFDESSLKYIKDASKKRRKRTKRRKKILSSSDISEAISTLDTADLNKVKTFEEKWNQPSTSADSFFPVSDICLDESSLNYVKDDKDIIIDEADNEKFFAPRRLRPIIIDGSNVARAHGTKTKTFSALGIKICVDYFLNRGHKEITVFVPQFRRHADRFKFYPTTNPEILEDLFQRQIVAFTPSRKVNGRRISSYDDRFMVELAAMNGGIIVSNDFFTDLIQESPSFKEAIEERLLQFVFVNDIFMVPNDPLGRNGPTLEQYLSFPLESPTNI